jgi:hypothetical protein
MLAGDRAGGGWLAPAAAPIRSTSVAFDIYLYYVRQGKNWLIKTSLN